MSHTFIELYTATPAWTTLQPEQRNAFFARIGAGMQQFDPVRITLLAMGRIARGVQHGSDEQAPAKHRPPIVRRRSLECVRPTWPAASRPRRAPR